MYPGYFLKYVWNMHVQNLMLTFDTVSINFE